MLINKELQPYFKAAALLGVLLLIGDTLMSAKFGWTISAEAMFIVAAISLASGILPVVAWFFLRAGHKPVAGAIFAAWALFAFPFNVYSNVGVSGANRMGEVQKAGLQETTYNERKKAVAESEAKLDLFTKQLGTLLEQNAWAASVTADGLREQSATLATAIEAESNKRNGGCKRKCLNLMNQKKEIDGQIGVAEQRTDLTKQIEATKTVLAKAREDLSTTDGGVSITANQASLYAKVVNWDLGGTPDDRSIAVANEITGIVMAIVLAVLAAATTLAGAYPALLKVGRINVNAREYTVEAEDEQPRARTETHEKIHDAMKAQGTYVKDDTARRLAELLRSVKPELRATA